MDLTPELRLARITNAHSPHVNPVLKAKYCEECENPWPCPTYITATADSIRNDPFDRRDVELFKEAGME